MSSNRTFIIPTIGTRGDVQPYIALALGLLARGHTATVATHPCMRALVEGYGVPFAPIGPDIDIGHEAAAIRARAPHWMVGFMRVMRFSFAMLEKSHADLLALCRGVDTVIVSHTAAGSIEADALGLPRVSVTLMPQAIPVNDPQDGVIKRAVMQVAGAGMGLMMSRPLDRIRKRLGVPPMGPTGITSPALNLVPISPHISPPHRLWEPRHRVTGYWVAPAPQRWMPPTDLQRFLEAGDPPVVVTLGAMALGSATSGAADGSLDAAQITLAAVQEAGVRAIVQGWDAALAQLGLPDTVFAAGSVPHDWLLARAGGLVHHGGFGTTAAGFRAGIPALVVPHIIDQFIWGQKVEELCVGPRAIPRPKLTVAKMAAALREMQGAEMRAQAADLGARIRGEPDGVQTAVSHIEEATARQTIQIEEGQSDA